MDDVNAMLPSTELRPPGDDGANSPEFRITSSSVIRPVLALVAGSMIIQVLLGADLVVLILAFLACAAGLAGFRLAGAHTTAGWLAFCFVLGNGIIALLAKTILLQALDSNLFAPLESFSTLAAGSIVLLITLVIALTIPVGKPVFRPVSNVNLLCKLSVATFVLGSLSWYLNRLFQDPDGSGFGGIGAFWNLLLMSVISRTAMILERTKGRKSLDTPLLLILTVCVVMGLIDNAKTAVALPVVSYFATSLFYRRRFTRWQIGSGAAGLLIMAAIIGPMIHAYRALGIQKVSWQERVKLLERGLSNVSVNGLFERYQQLASHQFASGFANYFGDDKGQMLLGRYASIQQIDPVIAGVTQQGTIGGEVVWPSFLRLVPSFIYPDKPRSMEGYKIMVTLGLIDPEGGKYPSVPLLAQSYAGYGAPGVLIIPFFTFLVFLLALKKLGWNLYRNVFAIFFFCMFIVVYANQGDVGQYTGAVLRDFPLLATILWLLVRIQSVSIRQLVVPKPAALTRTEDC
jgi:hypothetical protein